MDFSFIRGTTAEKRAFILPVEPLLEQRPIEDKGKLKTALKGFTEAHKGNEQAAELTRLYTAEQADHKRSLAMYSEYQNNIREAGQLRSELLKGTRAAEDSLSLLVKACKAIFLMTGDRLFYEQIEADVIAIYGAGLLEPKPLELELERTQDRLERLLQAEQRETQADTKARITAAIKSHKNRITELEDKLQREPSL